MLSDSQKYTFVQNKIRDYLIESVKRNHWKQLSDQDYLDKILHQLGYSNDISDYDSLNEWFNNLVHLDFLSNITNDNSIEEVILHSPKWIQSFACERKEFYGEYLAPPDWQLSLELLCLRFKQIWNELTPFVSFQLFLFGKKWRATFVHKSLTPEGHSKLFLRHQAKVHFDLDQFGVTSGQNDHIKDIILKKKNILVTGATGSGKTSFLQAMLSHTSEREHITVLEDTHEIKLEGPFVTNLISSPVAGKTLKDFCHYTMRMRPDRIILGEIRSSEVIPFLLSLNTGHKGMMASLHANSAIDAIGRLALLFQIYGEQEGVQYQDIIKLICQGIDYIIHIENKGISEIIEIMGSEGTTPYYKKWD